MAKSTDYADKLQGFASRIKNNPIELPTQKVTPVLAKADSKEEQQLNVWVSKALMKRLKVKGIETDKSIKEMVTEALELFCNH